jgi:hypothetical protein
MEEECVVMKAARTRVFTDEREGVSDNCTTSVSHVGPMISAVSRSESMARADKQARPRTPVFRNKTCPAYRWTSTCGADATRGRCERSQSEQLI